MSDDIRIEWETGCDVVTKVAHCIHWGGAPLEDWICVGRDEYYDDPEFTPEAHWSPDPEGGILAPKEVMVKTARAIIKLAGEDEGESDD